MNSLLGHPERLRDWLELPRLNAQSLIRWNIADGLCVGAQMSHQHAVPTVVIGVRGSVRIEGQHDIDLGPGDVLAIPPGCWHGHAPLRRNSLAFGLGFFGGLCDILLEAHDWSFHGFLPANVIRPYTDRIFNGEMEAVPLVLSLVTEQRLLPHPADHPAVERMFLALWKGMHHGITSEAVVNAAGIPRRTTYSLFSKAFNATPHHLLEELRLETTRALLQEGFSVSAAASRAGFPTRDALTRTWQRWFNNSPRSIIVKVPKNGRRQAVRTPIE